MPHILFCDEIRIPCETFRAKQNKGERFREIESEAAAGQKFPVT